MVVIWSGGECGRGVLGIQLCELKIESRSIDEASSSLSAADSARLQFKKLLSIPVSKTAHAMAADGQLSLEAAGATENGLEDEELDQDEIEVCPSSAQYPPL